MKKFKKIVSIISTVAMCLSVSSCGKGSDVNVVRDGAQSVVPTKTELIDNVNDAGYKVSEFDNIYDLQVSGERVLAEKGDKCIDICYGLSEDDAVTVYELYEQKYDSKLKSGDYYILAQNENFVYFISDKTTFKKSGFKSTDNVGKQHING